MKVPLVLDGKGFMRLMGRKRETQYRLGWSAQGLAPDQRRAATLAPYQRLAATINSAAGRFDELGTLNKSAHVPCMAQASFV